MATKRRSRAARDPESEATPEAIAEDVARLRAWDDDLRKRPERVLARLEAAAKAALRDFGLPDDLGPHLLADLPRERGRDYWKSHLPMGPAIVAGPDLTHVGQEPGRVWLDDYLRERTPEWRAAEILVAVREARRAASPADAVVWSIRARELAERLVDDLRRSAGRRERKRRFAEKDDALLKQARDEKDAHPRWSLEQLSRRLAELEGGRRSWPTIRDRLLRLDPSLGATPRPKRKVRSAK